MSKTSDDFKDPRIGGVGMMNRFDCGDVHWIIPFNMVSWRKAGVFFICSNYFFKMAIATDI